MVVLGAIIPLIVGIWLGKEWRGRSTVRRRFLQGLLLVFASNYLGMLRHDLWMWNTIWPDTERLHMFGGDWPVQLLRGAVNASVIPVGVYTFVFLFMRMGAAKQRVLKDASHG